MMQSRFRPELYAIDFGTTNSLLAAAGKSGVHPPIELDDAAPDPTIMRTVLYFPSAERCLYGARAIAEYSASGMQGRLIRSIKKHLPSRSFIGTYIEDRPMNLEDLIGAFLGELRARANRFFDADVRRPVLGRPARFAPAPEDDEHGGSTAGTRAAAGADPSSSRSSAALPRRSGPRGVASKLSAASCLRLREA